MRRRVLIVVLVIAFLPLLPQCVTATRTSANSQPIIVLLTDFGERDHYVGALKGAIYSANPSARIDSISHQISKFDIAEGAYTLAEAAHEYPSGTIFVAAVDPGVGSTRKGIAIRTSDAKIFIGPDNGLLSVAAEEAGVFETRELTNRKLMHPGEISTTFHGRDIFGPLAGHVSAGTPFEDVGPRLSHIVRLPELRATEDGGRVIGHVLHVDDYGNVITDIPIQMVETLGLRLGACASFTVGGKKLKARYVRTYSDVDAGALLFLANKGYVEIAINMGNLASETGAAHGMKMIVESRNEPPQPE
ncbi:MAG: SAM-dependent chlorinase/fluorinase [Candidatus Lindowbacteria bacterium]|nr:SAM-dependent chlorinase/fluorinase [Candidatus Lindowbacteria bacterium]